ncbi:3'-N-debenzoyl-2'-deoxytaxol N-benzoyltransferase, putative [Ricinus communis]|uniref:3'-N-debenzoyl-2'-deoxytaxol N-benzoyltransferase, putative n=1 Tax=Ricinus communis TaxID=3988 RepID=B9SDF5_RICCO|nr:3'-N-debenzoyl-2'-deoxytaxol N-benzoyltransferase, putative [Ricinus communis]
MAAQEPIPALVFNVYRHEPELIRPAKPTPHEFKPLSDIDDQDGLRVIKKALEETLVFYYPFAGRLREVRNNNRKLVVECTGEGILFVEAFADVSLDQFGDDAIRPPFPCFDELLSDVPGSSGIINCPLLLIQATRLKCGGIILAIRLNHTISDGGGFFQFWSTVSEMARGARAPSVLPIWDRHLLNARDPPRITCAHHEYVDLVDTEEQVPLADKDHRSFFLGPAEIASLRRLAPPHFHNCSDYEIITASFWRCRTIALQPNPNEEMRVICIVNARNKFNPPIPRGYYGNCIAYSAAVAKAEDLCQKPIGYALELVRKAKANVTEEYMRSVADLMVIRCRPWYTMVRTFLVSGVGKLRLDEVDFGWGRALYGGPAKGNVASFHIAYRKKEGEDGVLVTLCLPKLAMQRFVKELDSMLKDQPTGGHNKSKLSSAL